MRQNAGGEVEPREIPALVGIIDEPTALVQVADDFDQALLTFVLAGVALDQPADREVDGLPSINVDQGVSRLLNTVVLEPIGRIHALPADLLGVAASARLADQLVVLVQRNRPRVAGAPAADPRRFRPSIVRK